MSNLVRRKIKYTKSEMKRGRDCYNKVLLPFLKVCIDDRISLDIAVDMLEETLKESLEIKKVLKGD